MLQGDLATYPLPDLLQWLDQSRRAGVLEIDGGDGVPLWLEVQDRRVVRSVRPPVEPADLGTLARSRLSAPSEALAPEACADRIVDLFLSPGQGRFTWSDGSPGHDEGIRVDLGLGQITLEGVRRLDEWPELDARYPSDAALLRARGAGTPHTPGQRALLEAALRGASLGEARLALGISRPAVLRRVEALRELGLAEVDGVAARPDPVARLVAQAQALVAERQFDEASIVFKTLLAADPSDRRVRTLLREAEREQVAALYEELSPVAVPVLAGGAPSPDAPDARRLSASDREVAGRLNGRWDVATIALASPLREVETLKALRKLARLGIVRLVVRR